MYRYDGILQTLTKKPVRCAIQDLSRDGRAGSEMSRRVNPLAAAIFAALAAKDYESIVDAINRVGPHRHAGVIRYLLKVLRRTNDPALRNCLALVLGDMRTPEAFGVIAKLLGDNKTQSHRGTLLYALRGYDCSSLLPMLVDFVITGVLEVRNEAFELIISIDGVVDETHFTSCHRRLQEAAASADGDRRAMLESLAELFAMQT